MNTYFHEIHPKTTHSGIPIHIITNIYMRIIQRQPTAEYIFALWSSKTNLHESMRYTQRQPITDHIFHYVLSLNKKMLKSKRQEKHWWYYSKYKITKHFIRNFCCSYWHLLCSCLGLWLFVRTTNILKIIKNKSWVSKWWEKHGRYYSKYQITKHFIRNFCCSYWHLLCSCSDLWLCSSQPVSSCNWKNCLKWKISKIK